MKAQITKIAKGCYKVTCNGRTFEVTKCHSEAYGGFWWYTTENNAPPDLEPKRTLKECVNMIERFTKEIHQ